MLIRKLVTTLFFVFTFVSCTSANSVPALLSNGSSMPAFELKDHNGVTVSSTSLKGKIVAFEWLNPDCPFTRRHYRQESFAKLAKEFLKEVVFVSVNSTGYMDVEPSKNWALGNKITWPILIDQEGVVGKQFGARTTPHVFVFDASSKLVYQGAIDSDEYGTQKEIQNYLRDAIVATIAGKQPAAPETKSYGCSVKYR
jgi:peroxiredoxin